MDPEECEKYIFENVRKFYTGLNPNLDEDIPISLVDKEEMSQVRKKNYEMRRDIIGLATSIWDFKPIVTINRCSKFEDRIEVEKKTNKLTMVERFAALFGSNKHNKLLLLFGRPDVLMGMTLAHEMMHAWLRLQGLIGDRKPERLVEEGLCQVMSHRYGKWFCSTGFKHSPYNKTDEELQFTKDLNKYYANLKKTDSDEAYREGFKQAMHVVKENGLKKTLDYIVKKGRPAPKMEEDEDNCVDTKGSLPPHKNDVASPQGLQWAIAQ
ncbi:protein DA1-related 1-like [Prunus avium]|uniref:Protein DA1-related 1-like n=1 Tax=Prunus avium TaxID=42229 RepID=A0A6P5TUA5_PRUAV|nr:protein DA1-related 1-like [Prunus avium]